jgi:general secretion pathway protein G
MENTIEIEESKGKNKGFTLIELLIVIVILGILAAVTVFAVRGITNKGQDSACKTEQKTILTGIEAFYANSPTGVYPAALSDMVPAYMSTAPDTANWTYVTNAAAGPPVVLPTKYTLTGIGACVKVTIVGSLA